MFSSPSPGLLKNRIRVKKFRRSKVAEEEVILNSASCSVKEEEPSNKPCRDLLMNILKLYDAVRQTVWCRVSARQPLLAPSFTSAEHSSPRPRLRGGVGRGRGESKHASACNPRPLTWAPGRIEGPHQLVSGAGLSALISGPLPASSTSTRPRDLAAALHSLSCVCVCRAL